MRRMNNKGFAVSTLLYGILIMVFLLIFALMSTLGTTRKNTKNLTSKIEEELNNYAATNVTMMYDSSIDNPRTYITPSAGWYKIELWGSKYTYTTSANRSNLGYYTSGMIYLKENDHLYIHLGQNNVDDKDSYISLTEDEASIIMLASGGPIPGGNGHYIINGYAGTEVDNGGKIDTAKSFEIEYGQYDENGNAVLSDVYPVFYDGLAVPNVSNSNGKFRIQKVSNNDEDNPPGKDTNTKLNNVRYIRDCATGNSDNSHKHEVSWVELQAIANGKNVALNKNIETSPTFTLEKDGPAVVTDGKASDSNQYGTYTDNDGTVGEKCITLDLEQTYNLDEVAVWHYYEDGRNYYNHKLLVSNDKTNWTSLRETKYWTTPCGANGTSTCRYSTGEIETSLGIRYSRFQPIPYYEGTSFATNIEEGDYYIMDVTSDQRNKVITKNGDSISLSNFNADKSQIWRVKNIGNNQVTISNIVKGNSIEKSGNSSLICKNTTYNNNQRWIIQGDSSGYYEILDPTKTGPFYAITNTLSIDVRAPGSTKTRFKFIKVQ